jgi:hypothetical protein
MSTTARSSSTVLQRFREDRPLAAVELRPPRTGLSPAESMEVWIDMYHSMQRLARRDTVIFLTDNAVGLSEEENLAHLTANLAADVDPRRIVPFLTSKHSIEYCLMHASRAASRGFEAITRPVLPVACRTLASSAASSDAGFPLWIWAAGPIPTVLQTSRSIFYSTPDSRVTST